MDNNKAFREQIEQLIIKDDLVTVNQSVLEFLKGKDKRLYNTAIGASARVHNLVAEIEARTLRPDEIELRKARLIQTFGYILDEIGKMEEYENNDPNDNSSGSSNEKSVPSPKADFDELKAYRIRLDKLIDKLAYLNKQEAVMAEGSSKFELKQDIESVEEDIQRTRAKIRKLES